MLKRREIKLRFLVFAFVLTLAAQAKIWASTVVVRDDNNQLVAGAEVYQNCIYRGLTNVNGTYILSSAAPGDHLQVRKLIFTGVTAKGNHDGWGYHVWLTNVTMENDGSQTDYTILNPSVTQNILVRRQNAQIGFNMLASVEYNATPTNLDEIALGLERASEYLFDVSDGQMFLEKVTIYEDQEKWDDADLRYFVTAWPSANVGGPGGVTSTWARIYLPGLGFYGPWSAPAGFRTIVHEIGHYGFGVWDEYFKIVSNGTAPSDCTLDKYSHPETHRASIMSYQYDTTELCHDTNHNPDTAHHQVTGKSIWASLVSNWPPAGLWTWRTPMTRGAVNPGPNTLSCFSRVTPTIISVPQDACPPLTLTAVDWLSNPIVDTGVHLVHSGKLIYQGATNSSGSLQIHGAVPGDTVTLPLTNGNGLCFWVDGSAPVTDTCDPLNIQASLYCVPLDSRIVLKPTFLWDNGLVTFNISIPDPRLPINLLINQDGLGSRPVDLRYDTRTQSYTGSYRFDRRRALQFTADLTVRDFEGRAGRASMQLTGALFSIDGPVRGARAWPLMPADADVSLSVDRGSMPDRTGVMAAETILAGRGPEGLRAMSASYVVEGERRLLNPVGLNIRFHADRLEEVRPDSLTIYRYDNGEWTPLPTVLNLEAKQAYATIDAWGVYAIFAEPNL